METGWASSAPASATAETMQNKLNPNVPIARTVNGPEYSRTFTLPYEISIPELMTIVSNNFQNILTLVHSN